jgi:hypothetical protein
MGPSTVPHQRTSRSAGTRIAFHPGLDRFDQMLSTLRIKPLPGLRSVWRILATSALVVVLFSAFSCEQLPEDVELAPAPGDPVPENGAINQTVSLILTWEIFGDPTEVTGYDVYFGKDESPPLVAEDLTHRVYDPGELKLSDHYYWRVVVNGTDGAKRYGPMWEFNTAEGEWIPMVSGTSQVLRGVWYGDAEDFAVGDNGTIRRNDGTGWQIEQTGSSANFIDVWGNENGHVYVVGDNGTIQHYDGLVWQTMVSNTSQRMTSVCGTAVGDIFAVGFNGTIRQLTLDGNGQWIAMSSGTGQNLLAVWAFDESNVVAAGDNGTIRIYDGTSWESFISGTSAAFTGIWGTSLNDIFAVGLRGVVFHWDGATWTQMNPGTSQNLYSVWGTAGDDVFVAGDQGTIIHYNGKDWRKLFTGSNQTLFSVAGELNRVFAVGTAGSILSYGAPEQ